VGALGVVVLFCVLGGFVVGKSQARTGSFGQLWPRDHLLGTASSHHQYGVSAVIATKGFRCRLFRLADLAHHHHGGP